MVIIKYYMYFLTKSEVIICMEYVWKSSLGIGTMYISKSYTMTKILLSDNIQSMGSCSVNYY